MPDDVMDRFAQADPARDAGSDPDAPASRALLARAQARASVMPTRTRARRPVVAAAGATAAATLGAAALLVLSGGDPHGTPDARAAVLRAAQALPAAEPA
jgi:hypothetical protein